MKITQFLKEENGQYSSARVSAFLAVGCFCADWILHIVRGLEFNPAWSLVGLVAAIITNKSVQAIWGEKPDASTTLSTGPEVKQ